MFNDNKKLAYLSEYLRYLQYPNSHVLLYELQLMWCAEILSRYRGNKTRAAKKLGISLTSLKGYVQILQNNGIEVTPFDITSKTPSRRAYNFG